MEKKLIIIVICFLSMNFACKKAPERLYVSSVKGVILRSDADVNSKKITTLPFMAQVNVIETKNNEIFLADRYGKWMKVSIDNNQGWIFSGFLCEYNVESIFDIAAKYHSEEFKRVACIKEAFADSNKEYFNNELLRLISLKKDDISIIKIIDNYVLLSLPHVEFDSCYDVSNGNELWIYDSKSNTFKIRFPAPEGKCYSMDVLYLNSDNIPDFTLSGGCCGSWNKEIYIGDKNGNLNLDKTIPCSDAEETEPLCDAKKLKEYYSKQ